MNSFMPLVLGLSSAGTDEVRVTTFAAVLVVLTLILLLIVSFYTLQLVIDLRRNFASQPMHARASAETGMALQTGIGASASPISMDGEAVPPEIFAVIAAAVHVACAGSCRIVACVPGSSSELQEMQAWSHAGRIHLHDHRIA
jgi:hypothetical protein